MAKKQSDRVYRVIDVVGVSEKSWEDGGRIALERAAGSLRDLRVARHGFALFAWWRIIVGALGL